MSSRLGKRKARQLAVAGSVSGDTSPAPLEGEPHVRPVAATDFGGLWGSGSGYQGADSTRARGFVYFPEPDTRREVTDYTFGELRRRARFLVANVGFAGRLSTGIPRLVLGTGLMPEAQTSDREWNKLARQRWDARAGNALTYSLDGKTNCYTDQAISYGASLVDGDFWKVKAIAQDGSRILGHYESHQVANGTLAGGDDARSLFNGVRVDRHNRMVSARFIDPVNGARTIEIPAENLIHVCRHFRHGPARPPSRFHRAINHLLDTTEITAAFKGVIKTSAQKGYYIAKAEGAKEVAGWSVNRGPTANPISRQSVTLADGSTRKVNLEQILAEAGTEIPDLPPGYDLKMLLDQRPHPNTTAFLDHLARDISWGFDLAPEILWSIANIGRSNTYLVLADAQSFVEAEQQNHIDTVLGHEWLWFVQGEMMAGRLRPCRDPEWWKHGWIPPARWTLNKGSDGKLHLEQLRSGALTFRRFFGWEGLGLEQLDDWLDEMAYVIDGCASRPQLRDRTEEVLQRIYGRVGMAATPVSDGGDSKDGADDDGAAADGAADDDDSTT